MTARAGGLDAYRAKRDPRRTPEPFAGARAPGGRLFVVQKHAARALHYDVRLEIAGTFARHFQFDVSGEFGGSPGSGSIGSIADAFIVIDYLPWLKAQVGRRSRNRTKA